MRDGHATLYQLKFVGIDGGSALVVTFNGLGHDERIRGGYGEEESAFVCFFQLICHQSCCHRLSVPELRFDSTSF